MALWLLHSLPSTMPSAAFLVFPFQGCCTTHKQCEGKCTSHGEGVGNKSKTETKLLTTHSTRLLAQTTLRNTMGTRHLHEILSERMTISGTMQVSSKRLTVASWPGPPTSSLSLSKDSSDSVGLLPLIYLVYRHKEMYRENKMNQEEKLQFTY